MPPRSIVQDSFGGGIFQGRRSPSDCVFDCVNGLANDERELFRRGGSAYKSGSNADDTLLGLWEGQTVAGQRTFFWSDSSSYVLGSDDSTIINLGTIVPEPLASGVEIGGLVFFPGVVYGGSRKATPYGTGTITMTAGSTTVTGSGTSWLTNVDAGMILRNSVESQIGVVRSVQSDTSLTLMAPAVSAYGPAGGYSLVPIAIQSLAGIVPAGFGTPTTTALAVAGQRLLRIVNNRVYFSVPLGASTFYGPSAQGVFAPVETPASDYHELPRAAVITGADSIEDTAILFTTGGVWAISNLALDAFDDVGNVQHQVAQVNQDVVLWGEAGIAAYERSLIVPAIDDVYVMPTPGTAPIPISDGIRPLYRRYVEMGLKPGLATVYRGHYIFSVLDSSNLIFDTFACRLDLRDDSGTRRPVWTRLSNGASSRAYATRVGATVRTPELLALDGLRVSSLTGIFAPDATRKDDADGTDHSMTIVSRDFDTGPGLHGNTVLQANVEYELIDAASDNPTVAVSTASGPESAAFTICTAMATGAASGPESDGTTPVAFRVLRKVERIRVKFQTGGAAASAVLRRLELKVRDSGRQ